MSKIRISPQILTLDSFRMLGLMSGEAAPITLGRVTALAIAMAAMDRQNFTADEIDAISAWNEKRWGQRAPAESFATQLERCGMARRRGVFFTLDLPIEGPTAHGRGGEARAAHAARTPKGKFVGNKRHSKVSVDAEGNVLKGK